MLHTIHLNDCYIVREKNIENIQAIWKANKLLRLWIIGNDNGQWQWKRNCWEQAKYGERRKTKSKVELRENRVRKPVHRRSNAMRMSERRVSKRKNNLDHEKLYNLRQFACEYRFVVWSSERCMCKMSALIHTICKLYFPISELTIR